MATFLWMLLLYILLSTISPRSVLFDEALGRTNPTSRIGHDAGGGILDRGFGGLYPGQAQLQPQLQPQAQIPLSQPPLLPTSYPPPAG